MADVFADHEGGRCASQRVQLSLAVVTTLAAILAATCPAKAATPISSCPYTISAGGTASSPALYTLTQNLSCAGIDGIDIQASYVKLNLNGYRITGGGTASPTYGNGHGILVYLPSVRLTGIVITGPSPGLSSIQSFTYGIELDNVDNSTVQNVVLSNNLYGLSTDLLDQVNNTVTGLKVLTNTATQNAQNGIALFNSTGSTVSSNIAVGNGSESVNGGILIWGGGHNLVTLNNADGNVEDGIDIYNSSNNNVSLNMASGNNDTGIRIFVTSGSNSVFLNSAEGNRNNDLEDYDVSCGSNNWFSNVFNVSNPSTCIH
ncbi:MAG: right-handed parallel beta-helix repeat-containing protein [Terriglobia bacterium]